MQNLRAPEWTVTALSMLLGALLLATAGGWVFGFEPLWAFHFLAHLAWPLRLLLALMMPVLVLAGWRLDVAVRAGGKRPASRDELAAGPGESPVDAYESVVRPGESTTRPYFMGFLILVAAAILFWLFREQTHRGDALLKLELLTTQTLQTDPYIWKEPLDSLLAYTLTALLRRAGAGSAGLSPAEIAIALLSVLAGVIYVGATLYVASVLSRTQRDFYIYCSGLLALGSSQLWFGHIENYSLVTTCSFVTMALAIGYIRGERLHGTSLYGVGLAAGLAISFHPQAAFAMPALLVLLSRRQWPRQVGALALSGLVGPLITILGMNIMGAPWPDMTNGFAGDPQLFLTPAQAFAPQQLADALNNLWLVAPLAPLWLAGALVAGRERWAQRDRVFHYLAVVTVGLLLYHFFFQNDLPRPQDWDLFAIVGPGLTLFGIYTWFGADKKSAPKPWLWPSLAFAILFTLSWVGVNHVLTLIRPNPDQRELYAQYRLLDLTTILGQATVTPPDPICAEPASAETDCARVAVSSFTMPQDGDTRPVIFAHAPARVRLPLQAPDERAFLWVSPALDPVAWEWGGDGVTFRVVIDHAGEETLLWARHLSPQRMGDRDWHTVFIPLDRYRGQHVDLILETDPGPALNDAGDRAGWGLPWLMQGTPDVMRD